MSKEEFTEEEIAEILKRQGERDQAIAVDLTWLPDYLDGQHRARMKGNYVIRKWLYWFVVGALAISALSNLLSFIIILKLKG